MVTATVGRIRRVRPSAFLRMGSRQRTLPAGLGAAERAYLGAIAALALVSLGLALRVSDAPTAAEAVLFGIFALLVALAWLSPLPFAFKTDLCLDASLLLAAALLFDPAPAILVGVIGAAAAHLIRRKDAIESLFNTAQIALQVAAAIVTLRLLGWSSAELAIDHPRDIVAIGVAAVAMYAVSDAAVAMMVALQTRQRLLRAWWAAIRQSTSADLASQAAQIGLGLAAALLVNSAPWAILLLVIPAAAVHVSLGAAQTDRRRAEAALRNTEAALARAERIAQLGSWEWDLTTGRIHWSDEAHRILGAVAGDRPPTLTAYLAAVHPEDRARVDRTIHGALRHDGPFSVEHRVVSPEGREHTVHARGEVVRGATGDKERLVATLQDITDRKRTEQARDDLLASLSHDLKSPLTVIQGQAQLLRRKLDRAPEPAVIAHGLEAISASTRAMALQISELVEFARQEMGSSLPPGPVDLVELGRERVALFEHASDRHAIRMVASEERVVVTGDARQLGRALDNLLNNAFKYSPDGGEIIVRVRCDRDVDGVWGVVTVQDFGIGIPPEDLPRLFESYRRGSNVGRIEGSGIGLAGVRRLLALHGGSVSAASSPGSGTVITLKLPLVSPATARS